MKKYNILILMLLSVNFLNAKKIVGIKEVVNPSSIVCDQEKIYITEGTSIFIYSKKDFNLLKKFGQKGEGPKEFKNYVLISVESDYLFVNSQNKISYFTKDGLFKNEKKTKTRMGQYLPIGEMFVATDVLIFNTKEIFTTINLYNSDLEKVKEIFRTDWKFIRRRDRDFDPIGYRPPQFYTYNDKIYLDDSENIIFIFNKNGEKLHKIDLHQSYNKLKVTKKNKDDYIQFYKTHKEAKIHYPFIKNKIKFPKYFPIIRDFVVADHKIYILTFNNKIEMSEFLILDLKGNLLEKKFFPFRMKRLFFLFEKIFKEKQLFCNCSCSFTEE